MNELNIAFGSVAGVLSLALFLSASTERITEFVIRPLVDSSVKAIGRPGLTSSVLPYVTILMGALISWGFGLDLFSALASAVGLEPSVTVTRLLTALVVAGGSNLLHDLWPTGGQK